jgi:hypothetical protein
MGLPAGNILYSPLEQSILPSYVPQLDFTTVTQVYFKVTRQKDATSATWTAGSFTNVTTQGFVALYTFAGASPQPSTDLYIDGTYFLRPYLVTPSRTIACAVQNLYVVIP